MAVSVHPEFDYSYIKVSNEEGKQEILLMATGLIDSLFEEVNPGPVKAAMNMLGMCNLEYRLPICSPTNKTQFLIYDALEEYGLI
jgi:4-hydroxy-tetrahydrodipicolinate synthase